MNSKYKRSYIWSLTKEEIQLRVNRCHTIKEMLAEFGYSMTSGSMYAVMRDVIEFYDINISHFTPTARTGEKLAKYSLEEILVPNSSYTNVERLKKRLLKANLLEYKCAICGNTGFWNGKSLSLQLDHKDGNHYNHTLSNLRLLCPNCHSQTETYGSKNIVVKSNTGFQQSQFRPRVRPNSVKCPDKDVLIHLLNNYSYSEIARQRGVSSNTVKKWAKFYGIYEPCFKKLPDKYILEEQLKHYSQAQLGELYGVSKTTIRNWIKKLNVDALSKLSVQCVETGFVYDTKSDAARSVYPELQAHSAANGIAYSCKTGCVYRNYHWVKL